jgi:hypothetical protein
MSRINGTRLSRLASKALRHAIEELEPRQLLSVAQNPISGWTIVKRDNGVAGRNIYVDNTALGSDSNSGLDAQHPVKTISHAESMITGGQADWLLLRAGDQWNESLGFWSKSGPGPVNGSSNPMVIGAYWLLGNGSVLDPSTTGQDSISGLAARPIIHSSTSDGISFQGTASHIVVESIQFMPDNTATPSLSYNGANSIGVTGLRAQLTATDYLVENCLFQGYKDDVVVGNPTTPVSHFTLRRCEVLDSYNHAGAHSQGFYASGSTSFLTIQGNVFDHDGWKNAADKTVFNHDMYINTGATFTLIGGIYDPDPNDHPTPAPGLADPYTTDPNPGNIILESSLRGTLLRSGGTVVGNFYDQDSFAIQVGHTISVVKNNVILEGTDLPSLASGVGIDAAFSIPNVDIENNIVAHDSSASESNVFGISVDAGGRNATILNNIVYDWRRPLTNAVTGGTNIVEDNMFEDFSSGTHPIVNYAGSGATTFGNNGNEPSGDITDSVGNIFYTAADQSKAFQDGNTRESLSTFEGKHGQSPSTDIILPVNHPTSFTDPNRDMGSYNASLGGTATFNAWIVRQRAQSRTNWDSRYTAEAENGYIQDGFDVSDGTSTAPTINVTASDPSASEIGPDNGVFTLTRTGDLSLPLTLSGNDYQFGGTATLNTDYALYNSDGVTPFTGFFFAPSVGSSQSISVVVKPMADSKIEGDESVKLNIFAPSGSENYQLGANASAIVTITDGVAVVNVQADDAQADENGADPGDFTLTRSGVLTSPLTVNLQWSGDAIDPTFYQLGADPSVNLTQVTDSSGHLVTGTITFPAGVASASIQIVPTGADFGVDEDGETPITSESVGLTVLPDTHTPLLYVPGITPADTVVILNTATPPDGGGSGPGGGSVTPPTGQGLSEIFYNGQDQFLGSSVFNPVNPTSLTTVDTNAVKSVLGNPVYGPVTARPGFNFTSSIPLSGVSLTHNTAFWTGQIQPDATDSYTLSLMLDGDASARLWLQDDIGQWIQLAQTNDTDSSNLDYASGGGYFTHRLGDANDDALVDIQDFNTLAQNYGKAITGWSNADFNSDGVVNLLDLNVIASKFATPDPRPANDLVSTPQLFLDGGVKYNIVIEYSNKAGPASMRLFWNSPTIQAQSSSPIPNGVEVPASHLYPTSTSSSQSVNAATPSSSLFSSTSIDSKDASASVLG